MLNCVFNVFYYGFFLALVFIPWNVLLYNIVIILRALYENWNTIIIYTFSSQYTCIPSHPSRFLLSFLHRTGGGLYRSPLPKTLKRSGLSWTRLLRPDFSHVFLISDLFWNKIHLGVIAFLFFWQKMLEIKKNEITKCIFAWINTQHTE